MSTWALSDESGAPVAKWDPGRPHRCPSCCAVASGTGPVSAWKIYQCCRCLRRFCAYPSVAALLPSAGITCPEHRDREDGDVRGRLVYRTDPLPAVGGAVREVTDDGAVRLSLDSGDQEWTTLWDIEGSAQWRAEQVLAALRPGSGSACGSCTRGGCTGRCWR